MNQPGQQTSTRGIAAADGGSAELTNSQSMIWAGQQLALNSPLYNMALRFDIHTTVDTELFKKAFQRVVDQNDAMRTIITSSQGIPRQSILDHLSVSCELVDLSHHDAPKDACKQLIDERCRRPMDLAKWTFDSAIFKVSDQHFVWFLNQHHIVTDAWSMSLIYDQVEETYRQLRAGLPLITNEAHTYAQYREFEAKGRIRPAFHKATSYWADGTNKALTPLRLYGNQIGELNSKTERIAWSLGTDRSQRLRQLAEQSDVRMLSLNMTFFNLFCTAYVAFLHKVSRQDSFVIGTPAHNRSSLQFRKTIGLLMEVFPIHIALDENETFRTLHAKVAEAAKNFLLNAVPGSSSIAGNRRVSAVLNYIHATFSDFAGASMTPEWIHAGSGDPRHIIRLQVHDFAGEGNFRLYFDVNETVVPKHIRHSIPQHFAKLLDALLDELDRPIEQVALISSAEVERMVTRFNSATVPRAPNSLVLDLFDRCVKRHPHSTAIVDGGTELTYQQLQQRSLALAAKIRDSLPAPTSNHWVGICLSRSTDLVVSILGVLYSRAAYVPIDPAFPDQRIKYILDDTRAALVISDSTWGERFGQVPNKTIDRTELFVVKHKTDESSLSNIARADTDKFDDSALSPRNDAYVIYTSGSTGNPKGVVVDHGGLAEYVQWARDTYVKQERLAFPFFSPLSFDLTVTSIFVPLVSGGRIIVYAQDDGPADLSILRVFDDNLVDVVKLTPAHLSLLSDKDLSESRVRTLIVGGEDLTVDLASRIHAAFAGRVAIYNEYGPTEAVVGCMIHQYDPKHDLANSVPIGMPATNRHIYLLDQYQNVVPEGVPGEICIGGAGLAKGYHNLADETAQRFVADPFSPSNLMYRTGDLARFNHAGQIEFIGRIDRQIKIRGVRIEPSEIENTLLGHPAVTHAVVDVISTKAEKRSTDTCNCQRCGIPSDYPNVQLDEKGICDICNSFDQYKNRVADYFRTMDDLQTLFDKSRQQHHSEFDCVALLSGGKDSTYALVRLVNMGLRVLTATLDNGYISDGAKENIERIARQLGVKHVYLRTSAMNEIFVDSLNRHSNVCQGCFKTIYTLAVHLAHQHKIPIIVTGLSRGQLFETRLTKELFDSDQFDSDDIDRTVLEARKAYHRYEDAVFKHLDVSLFQTDEIFDEVQFVDFYRYCDVQLEEMLDYLRNHVPWVRPEDTGRSTNCLINDAGIFVHLRKERFHNYALPYSWDVRMGHKNRDAAMEELNDHIDPKKVKKILDEIGYHDLSVFDPPSTSRLAVYFTTSKPIAKSELEKWLRKRLPTSLIPSYLVAVNQIPLTANGKVDREKLPSVHSNRSELKTSFSSPKGELEMQLASIWQSVLPVKDIGRSDNFFDLGGDSISAIQIVARANHGGIRLTAAQLFDHQTIAELAKAATLEVTKPGDTTNHHADRSSTSTESKRTLPSLNSKQLAQLSRVLSKRKPTD